jgi:hypothetical protein
LKINFSGKLKIPYHVFDESRVIYKKNINGMYIVICRASDGREPVSGKVQKRTLPK